VDNSTIWRTVAGELIPEMGINDRARAEWGHISLPY